MKGCNKGTFVCPFRDEPAFTISSNLSYESLFSKESHHGIASYHQSWTPKTSFFCDKKEKGPLGIFFSLEGSIQVIFWGAIFGYLSLSQLEKKHYLFLDTGYKYKEKWTRL